MTARLAALASFALGVAACGSPPSAAAPAPSGEAIRVVPDGIDGRALLGLDAERASAAGAGPVRVVGAEVAAEGDRVGAFVELRADVCALVFARATPGIADVDLYAYEDDGDAFAVDESPDSDAALMLCPPHPRRLYVVGRVMSGAGLLAVGVQEVPHRAVDLVARVAGARGRPGDESGRLEAWPGLEARITEHRRLLGARWEDVRRVAVPVDPHAPTRVSARVDAGRCLDVLVVPSDEVPSLDVVVEDASGRVVARARERAQGKALVLCSAGQAELTIAVRPRASQGLVAVIVGRSAVGAESEITDRSRVVRVTPTVELREARALLEKRLGGRGLGAARTVAQGLAKVGIRSTFPIELPAGCSRVDVLAGKPLASVLVELWDESGAAIARGEGGAGATLFACGPSRRARAEVEALDRPGPFAIELRVDAAASSALTSHPLAASRVLARLEAAGEPVSAASAASARVVPLEAGRMVSVPVTVPAGACVEVIAAMDAGGSGLGLRVAEIGQGEAALVRGRDVVSDRLCAGGTPRAAQAELRLGVGKGEALVLVRLASGG